MLLEQALAGLPLKDKRWVAGYRSNTRTKYGQLCKNPFSPCNFELEGPKLPSPSLYAIEEMTSMIASLVRAPTTFQQ